MERKEIEKLFRRHYGQMIRQAKRMLYDDEESRDVVSEVFATLLQPSVTPDGERPGTVKNMEAYLLMSVRNRCLNLLEHKSVRARFEQAYTAELSSDTSWQAEDERLQRLLEFAEHNLPPQALRVFHLRHLEGLKYQEIANRMGISRIMVYKHLALAMERITEYRQKTR